MRRVCLQIGFLFVCAGAANGAPITVGGFTFTDGEAAFADDAFLVSGTIRMCGGGFPPATSIDVALSGSNVSDCANNNTGDSGIIEILFNDNSVVNGPGPDLVIFELSGPLALGTPDPRERFELSVFDGTAFTPLQGFDPIATGFNSCGDPSVCLDLFAVAIDLGAFGLVDGATTGRLQLRIFDVGLGTKSADITAVGALNSQPVPEPSTLALVLLGFVGMAMRYRRRPVG
jgi:hypothetical protein